MSTSLLKDRYELLRKLGSGGFSMVFAALDTLLDREVAIKILKASLHEDEELVHRFLLEAKLTSKLTHPNALTVHDFGRDDKGHCFFVTELLLGQSLHDRLNTQPLSILESLSVTQQVSSALGEAHSKEVVHRDIKPGNIFLCKRIDGSDPLVKLLDFGIAKSIGFDGQTVTGQMMGTPTYMSPEQIVNIKDVDHRTDIYSLGIVLYHMLCGVPPFKGDSYFDTMRMHMQAPLPKLTITNINSDVYQALSSLLNKMTNKDKFHRFANSATLNKAIIDIQTSILRLSTPSSLPKVAVKKVLPSAPMRAEDTQKSEPPNMENDLVHSLTSPQPSPSAIKINQAPDERVSASSNSEPTTDPFDFLRDSEPINLDLPAPIDPFAIHSADKSKNDFQVLSSASSSIKLKLPSLNSKSKKVHNGVSNKISMPSGVNAEFTYAAGRDAHLSQIAPSPAKIFRILILDPNEYASELYRKGLIAGADRRAAKRKAKGISTSDIITVSMSTTEQSLIEDLEWGAHLILVDLKSRDGKRESEGIDLLRTLKSLRPKDCRIIALCKEVSYSAEAIEAGADAVLTKPVRNHQLFDAVAVYLWDS